MEDLPLKQGCLYKSTDNFLLTGFIEKSVELANKPFLFLYSVQSNNDIDWIKYFVLTSTGEILWFMLDNKMTKHNNIKQCE